MSNLLNLLNIITNTLLLFFYSIAITFTGLIFGAIISFFFFSIIGLSLIYLNDFIGTVFFLLDGNTYVVGLDPVRYKPLNENHTYFIMLVSTLLLPIGGAITGAFYSQNILLLFESI